MPENTRSDCLVEARNLVKYYPILGGVFLKEVAAVKAVGIAPQGADALLRHARARTANLRILPLH